MNSREAIGGGSAPINIIPFAFMLDRRGARRLQSLVTIIDLQRDQVLARQGEIGRDFLIMADGVLKLVKEIPDGRRQILAFRTAGDLVTLHRCDTPWPVTAEAVVASRVYSIDWDGLRRLASQYPEIDRALLDLAGDEVTSLQDHLLALGRKTADEKVASFLLGLCRHSMAGPRMSREFTIPMRRPDIADYLGLTTETVCREFTRLKQERIVALPRPSTVVLLNRPALEALAAGTAGIGTIRMPVAASDTFECRNDGFVRHPKRANGFNAGRTERSRSELQSG